MRSSPPPPDPIVTANVYACGQLDEVVLRVIGPFTREVRLTTGRRLDLWTVRYRRRGEHLKVRIHGVAEDREILQRMLERHVDKYFNNSETEKPTIAHAVSQGPAIDVEDEQPGMATDRSLVWTTYRRSPVSLASPWLSDDRFTALSCACLASGCDLLLSASDVDNKGFTANRERLLSQALLVAMRPLGFDDVKRAGAYLQYHRDWLLRFFLRDVEIEQRAIEVFDAQVHERRFAVDKMRRIAFARPISSGSPMDALARLADTLANFGDYVRALPYCPEYEVDPYASDNTFVPIFKVLHGFANQLGLLPLQEAYAYHLLLAVMAPSGQALRPALSQIVESL